ncbi:MAG: hypothetical protein JNJ77_06745 [Planctomycetia bacterium]|nr:hypothetical protein [Planctomycetia bacterium]
MTMTLQGSKKTPPDILRWLPDRWDQFIGNRQLKRYLQKLLVKLRKEFRRTGKIPEVSRLCFLVTGESRSGKTSLIKHFVRSLTCSDFNDETMEPCKRTCIACRERPEKYGLHGLFATAAIGPGNMPVHLMVVDCTKLQTPDQLRKVLIDAGDWDDGLRVFYFDEVHRLIHKQMEEMLLKEVEEKNFLWFFSTAKPQNLEDMFLNRLLKLKTELPESKEMEHWLVDLCDQWGIAWEPEAILRVVEKCNRVPGTALHALAMAAMDPDIGLTLELVENEWTVKLGE